MWPHPFPLCVPACMVPAAVSMALVTDLTGPAPFAAGAGAAWAQQVGCGAGNSVFPLLEINPASYVYACDFSPRAVELVQAHPAYTETGVSPATNSPQLAAGVARLSPRSGVCCKVCRNFTEQQQQLLSMQPAPWPFKPKLDSNLSTPNTSAPRLRLRLLLRPLRRQRSHRHCRCCRLRHRPCVCICR